MNLKKVIIFTLMIALMLSNVIVTSNAITGNAMSLISFEEGEDLSTVTVENGVTTEYVSDGTRALMVDVGTLDSEVSGIRFEDQNPFNWGNNATFKAILTNPNSQAIQIRINIMDTSQNVRTYYFTVSANTTRTIIVDNLGPASENFTGADGWWGAENGLDQSNILMFQFYLNEEMPGSSGNTFIVNNIEATSSSSNFKISFEPDETINYMETFGEATTTYTTKGISDRITDGVRALKVNVGTLDAEYNGIVLSDNSSWDFGEFSAFSADIKNPGSATIQLRVNITDDNGETRTNYFTIGANTSRNITASYFGPLESDFTQGDGWWGAEDGLDVSNIASVKIYLWEEGTSVDTIYIDNIKVSSPADSTFEKISFESGIPACAEFDLADGEIVTQGATDGSKAIKVNFGYGPGTFPNIGFFPNEPYNWGYGTCLSVDITNPSSNANTVYMNVTDGNGNQTTARTTLLGNETKSVYMSFNPKALDLAMRFFPPTDGRHRAAYAWGSKSIDLSNIVQVQFWLYTPTSPSSLIFDNIKVEPDPTLSPTYLDGIIDQFGQYTGKDWPSKINSVDDLIASKNAELQELNAGNPNLPNTAKYGGWLDGPQLTGTGHFRTEKYNGKWALVDPQGYLFFSTGVDILRFSDMDTWIESRENMFVSVPSHDGPLADHYRQIGQVGVPPNGLTNGWVYNYYTANLEQKYGSNYVQEWVDMSLNRFKNWGFSTLGNWSDPSLFWAKGDQAGIAYVADTWIRGNFSTINYDGDIPDPFDPAFRTAARSAFTSLSSSVKDDPWCVGIFVNNEMRWGNPLSNAKYSVVDSALQKNALSSHGKRAIVAKLKEKYNNNITELNNSWETTFNSWSNVEAPFGLPGDLNAGFESDVSMILKMIATEYYKVVNEELDAVMPDMLNLGSRIYEVGVSTEVQEACAQYVDVVSYNCYKNSLDSEEWIIADQLDMPCIIGEFHFGADDERMFGPGLVAVTDQEERGRRYKEYITFLLESPYFVGGHWFQYVDQPNTGRAWDGENYNAGFVDIADVPYDKLVNAAKEIHSRVYDIKYGTNEEVVITLNHNNAQIDVNTSSTLQLTATVTPDTISNKNIIWFSNNTSVATVDNNGLVTAVGNGTAIITATSEFNPSANDTCSVTVVNIQDDVEVTLNQSTAQIDVNTSATHQLTATITPDTLSNKNIIWSSSNTFVATVDSNGLITAIGNGTATITATSEFDSTAQDTCEVTVTGFTTTPADMTKISFEASENLDFMSTYNEATVQFTTQGVIDGTRALLINVGTLDTNYSGIKFEDDEPSDWGDDAEFKAYLTNSNNEDIQIRIDINDTSNNTRTNYFTLTANTSRTITIDNLGPQTPSFSGGDGWWGADNGIDVSNIDSFEIYLYEERPNLAVNTFVVDNIEISDLSSNFKVSFESDENLDIMSIYNEATTQFTTQGVSDGARALSLNVGTLDAIYSGISFDESTPFDWGDNAVFKAYVTNPNNEAIQIRINIRDTSNDMRTNYFTLNANTSRTITIDNLGAQSASFSGTDGWWGAENGLDQSNIDSFQIYLWEEKPNLTSDTFIVDSIEVVND